MKRGFAWIWRKNVEMKFVTSGSESCGRERGEKCREKNFYCFGTCSTSRSSCEKIGNRTNMSLCHRLCGFLTWIDEEQRFEREALFSQKVLYNSPPPPPLKFFSRNHRHQKLQLFLLAPSLPLLHFLSLSLAPYLRPNFRLFHCFQSVKLSVRSDLLLFLSLTFLCCRVRFCSFLSMEGREGRRKPVLLMGEENKKH